VGAELPAARLAAKLDRLFRSTAARRRGEYTYREVVDGIAARGLPPISPTYVWQLRTGQRANPTRRHLESLAGFFGVPISYFFDDEVAARIDADLDLIVTLGDSAVRQLALDAAGLSPDSLAALCVVAGQLRRLENSSSLAHHLATSADTTERPHRRRVSNRRRRPSQPVPPPA
jgi:transcriptional regulator with XRE-family HTH domain